MVLALVPVIAVGYQQWKLYIALIVVDYYQQQVQVLNLLIGVDLLLMVAPD